MCNFPSKTLLLRRREVVKNNGANWPEVVRAIDESRWRHEERTGCKCWDEARAELNEDTKERGL